MKCFQCDTFVLEKDLKNAGLEFQTLASSRANASGAVFWD